MNGEDWGYREWGVKQVRTGKQESRDGGWGGGSRCGVSLGGHPSHPSASQAWRECCSPEEVEAGAGFSSFCQTSQKKGSSQKL